MHITHTAARRAAVVTAAVALPLAIGPASAGATTIPGEPCAPGAIPSLKCLPPPDLIVTLSTPLTAKTPQPVATGLAVVSTSVSVARQVDLTTHRDVRGSTAVVITFTARNLARVPVTVTSVEQLRNAAVPVYTTPATVLTLAPASLLTGSLQKTVRFSVADDVSDATDFTTDDTVSLSVRLPST